MWQKVAKFKGAEYFRKALYGVDARISAKINVQTAVKVRGQDIQIF